jgi:hypothetical protein
MMNLHSAATVPVYNFLTLEHGVEDVALAGFKTTREKILDVYQGRVLEGTKELVSAEALDDAGRYRRVATGWGALG